ncbi:MAG: linear amide C-N hydrolase [Phycisphaerales bacterium]
MTIARFSLTAACAALALAIPVAPSAKACTRVVYLGPSDQIITGRTMDWKEDMSTNLWVFPRGMQRDSGVGQQSLSWTSRYGSVISSVYEAGTADGMNEKGLVANLLYLVESEFSPEEDDRPALVISSWAQYKLDNFATVKEAVADARREHYRMVTVEAPNGAPGTVHLSLADATGDSAIFEYIEGKLVIHHSRDHQVMTNSPVYEQQLALNRYWQEIGGTVMLPGTNRAADRFVRASFYINAVPQTDDPYEAVAAVFSVIRNCSVPRGITTPDQPNISSTIWRTVSDHKNLIYYYENTAAPSILWVDLKRIDFSEGSGSRKLDLTANIMLGGDQTASFRPASPFRFLTPQL